MVTILSVKEQAYEIIKKKILSQEFAIGARININELAQELGVSNSPIREALSLLEQQGLVVSNRSSSLSVVTFTPQDQYETSQMYLFWMIGAYQFCCETNKVNILIEKMEAILATQKKHYKDNNIKEFTYYANLFDRCIIEVTGNRRMLVQYDNIFPLFYLGSIYFMEGAADDRQIGLEQHELILQAMKEERHADVINILEKHYYKPMWDLRNQ